MESTLAIIKPDGMINAEAIITKIKENDFCIGEFKKLKLTKKQTIELYEPHKGTPYFNGLIKHMRSGDIIAIILYKENAIKDFRTLIGATNPANAEEGTIRKLFGTPNSGPKNAIHGSDSQEAKKREEKIIFK